MTEKALQFIGFTGLKKAKRQTSCLYLPHRFEGGHHSALRLTLLRRSVTEITFNLKHVYCAYKGEGQVPPATPKDALNSCGEGNLGRSALLFYFLLLAPVEEPPATSQQLTCFPYSYRISKLLSFRILLVSRKPCW